MGDFFHGWKRKVGTVTLVMALVFVGGWMRSQVIGDAVQFPANQGYAFRIGSSRSDLFFGKLSNRIAARTAITNNYESGSVQSFDPFSRFQMQWTETFCGIRLGKGVLKRHREISAIGLRFPYWMAVILSTLLSACLLLTKLRSSTPKKITESIPETVK